MKNLLLTIIIILTVSNCLAQDTIIGDSFELRFNNKVKYVEPSENVSIVTIYRQDSTKLDIEPQAIITYTSLKDTIVVRPSRIEFYNRAHNEKPWSQSSSYFPNTKTEIKLSIADIDKIKVKRDGVRVPTAIIGYASLISALIVAPIVSVGKEFNYKRYSTVAGYSLITMTASLTIHLAFGTKTYHLKKYKNKKTWTLK